jgi:hypothetical protein
MKRLTVIAGIGVVVAAAGASSAGGPEWYITTVDEYEGEVGAFCSLRLDAADNPHIVYWDAKNHSPRYAYWGGTAWDITVVDPMDRGSYSSLALDSAGHPHIAYGQYFSPFFDIELKYAYHDGNKWHITKVDTTGHAGAHTSIALDSQGRPHIAYGEHISKTVSNLKYAFFDGEKWQITHVDWGDVGLCISLALDSNDRPHISYRDDDPNFDLKYATYDGTKWQVETVDTSFATGKGTSLALDSADLPHISYQEDLTEAVKYAYFDGGRWKITVVDEDHVQHKTSLALDERDRPHITYCAEWGTGGPHWTGEIRYAYLDGATWHKEVIERGGEDESLGGWNSLALAGAGAPHVAYQRDVGIEGISSLKYARRIGDYLNYFTAAPRGYDGLALTWSVKAPPGESVTGYYLYRREKGEEEWSKITDTPLPGGGSGSFDDAGLACLRCYEYLLEGIMKGGNRQLGVTEGTTGVPQAFFLHSARPNPSSNSAVIAFELMDRADVELTVYDLSGRKVATLAQGWLPPGSHERACDVSALAPGVYVYRLKAGDWAGAKKMVVVR